MREREGEGCRCRRRIHRRAEKVGLAMEVEPYAAVLVKCALFTLSNKIPREMCGAFVRVVGLMLHAVGCWLGGIFFFFCLVWSPMCLHDGRDDSTKLNGLYYSFFLLLCDV